MKRTEHIDAFGNELTIGSMVAFNAACQGTRMVRGIVVGLSRKKAIVRTSMERFGVTQRNKTKLVTIASNF